MNGRRMRAINPAFAAAHGIQQKEGNNEKGDNGNQSLHFILKRAQDTGKLVAANCSGLKVPLPDEVFHFPFGLSRYTEDLLTVVDFSDNEEQLGNSILDERILKFRSVRSLRFRNCGLRLPPPKQFSFSSLEHLTILDLSGNNLDGTFDIGRLLWSPDNVSQLTELNLSNNQLQEIAATTISTGENATSESCVVSLPNLQTLNVSHNSNLEVFLEESSGNASFSCENLRILRCHHNPRLLSPIKTGSLFPFLESCKSTLEVLEVSHNSQLGRNAIDLSDFEKLQTVSLAMNKLEHVPRISHSVKILDLNSNKLKSIEGMISRASSSELVDLMLADNYLTQLDPPVVECLANLKRLDLTSNKIRTLPYQLGFLTELSMLNISGNPVLTRFSSVAANSANNPKPLMETLRKRAPAKINEGSSGTETSANKAGSHLLAVALSTKGNNSLDLTGRLAETAYGRQAALDGLVQELKSKPAINLGITGQIILDSNQLDSVPEDLLSCCLPNVHTISLVDNHLAQLPASLQSSQSKNIKQLRLGKNKLTSESLERAFWFQSVSSSPSSFSWSLRSLTHLDLSSNKLTSFPMDTCSSVNCFPALEFLNLFNNKLSSLQDWKRLPESLIALDLSENDIADIEPLSVLLGRCPSLQKLSLVHNNVRRIPASLGLLSEFAPRIISLNVQGNPQRGIPSHVLEKPCAELLKYLSNRLTPDQRRAIIEKIELQNQQQHIVEAAAEAIPPTKNTAHICFSDTLHSVPIDTHKEAASCESQLEHSSSHQPSNNELEKKDERSNCERDEEDNHKVLKELQESVEKLKADLGNLSLTQAKKYAVKKALAMERSKLIREERRLGLRK